MASSLRASVSCAAAPKAQVQRSAPVPAASTRARNVVVRAASDAGVVVSRRVVLDTAALTAFALATPQMALAAKGPGGFSVLEDRQDGYTFNYPFGWQEVSISGADIVFKDVIEPLESVSVTMVKATKDSIAEYGSLAEVTETLAKSVLTAPGTDVKILKTSERTDDKGHQYYEIEFTADKPNRHQLAVVTVANGRFYTLTCGSSERRWGKMGDRLKGTIASFSLLF